MLQLLRDYFRNWTVIAIAHKLDSIMHFDKVAVMSDGRLVECDSPRTLLQNPRSNFKSLYDSMRQIP